MREAAIVFGLMAGMLLVCIAALAYAWKEV